MLAIVLALVALVDGSKLEPNVSVSIILSKAGKRGSVITQDSRVVLLKEISFREGTKVFKTLQLILEL